MKEPSVERVLAELAMGTPEAPVPLGRYDVIGRLGRGGMGTVYEAVDRERGTKVALKTLSATDAAAGGSLKREFRVVADLAHDNLAPVYELTSDRGVWFFTMEHVEGVSLTEWARDELSDLGHLPDLPVSRTHVSVPRIEPTVKSAGVETAPSASVGAGAPAETPTRRVPSMSAAEDGEVAASAPTGMASPPTRETADLRRALAELVGAIGALHDAGLRHGDVKPANVLVRRDGRVVLVDFGLARPMKERHTARTPSGGTPTFMAPEQLAGEVFGPATDWYAVGATLYRVLTGWPPFVAISLIDLYFKKLHQLPPAPHDLLPEVPADLSRLALDLMNPDASCRPDRDAILRVLLGEASSPEPSTDRPRRGLFVGRDEELAALERAYGSARGGSLMLVHTHGPSGIGKSALLTSFLGAVQDVDSALVLRGRCYERETVPYKAFDRVLDEIADHLLTLDDATVRAFVPEWAGELGRAFPALAAVPAIADSAGGARIAHDPFELRRRAWIALGELLAALRLRGPVVLAIDDLQWADADSAQLLEELLRGARGALLVVILFRPAEAAKNAALAGYFDLQSELAGRGRFVDLPLGGLSEKEAEELARAALADLGAPASESRARRLAAEARGVPFFIEELAHFLGTRALETSDAEVSLDSAILARIRALPADQRGLVEIVAVANSPLSQSILFDAAGLDAAALPALLALRSASLVSWLGVGADDTVSVYHDRIRESVVASLGEARRLGCHLALGRALARRHADRPGHWVFDAVRHLGAAGSLLEDEDERLDAARLHADAGEQARRAAAFPLAFECCEGGIAFLPDDAWERDYALALRLHSLATEAAYLSASWDVLDRRIADVKRHAKTSMDQVAAWEAQIDALAGRHEYAAAVDAALEVLALLGVDLPRDPDVAEVGKRVQLTLERLTEIGPDRLSSKPDLADPVVAAATRIQVRASPAAYFGKPMLLPIIACNLVTSSIDRGVSTATPYALALFGIVLNTLDLHPVAHRWGRLALELTERWPDRRLEAATKHLIFNLVCC
ncbi:MAG TPA: AAA family ATPase [Polyangiaceae bacterium]|nr:AAA family ATPase [Polyangiaceae bacterium]